MDEQYVLNFLRHEAFRRGEENKETKEAWMKKISCIVFSGRGDFDNK